jgi:hypothetical protein
MITLLITSITSFIVGHIIATLGYRVQHPFRSPVYRKGVK